MPTTATPAWLRGLGRDQIAQYTGAMRRPFGGANMRPMSPIQAGLSEASAAARGRPNAMPQVPQPAMMESRYTGAGADGVVQPLNRAGMAPSGRGVDEGEMIVNAQDTQNIGQDLLGTLVEKSRSGQLDPQTTNRLRIALGLAPEERMYTGTKVNDFGQVITSNAAPAENNFVFKANPYGGGTTVSGSEVNNMASSVGAGNLMATRTGLVNAAPPSPTLPPTSIVAPPPARAATPARDRSGFYRDAAMGSIYDTMTGQNKYYDAMTDQNQKDAALRAAAQEGTLRQSIAQRDAGGTGAAGAELAAQRIGAESDQIAIAGKGQELKMGQMEGAAKELAQESRLDLESKKSDRWKEYNAQIAAGDFTNAAATYQSITGNPIDVTRMESEYKDNKNKPLFTSGRTEIERLLALGDDASIAKATSMYNDMKANPDFALYMPSFTIDPAKASSDYSRSRFNDASGDIGVLQASNTSWEQNEPAISAAVKEAILSYSPENTWEEYVANHGGDSRKIIKDYWDDRTTSATPTGIAETYLRQEFGQYFDTPAEAAAAASGIAKMIAMDPTSIVDGKIMFTPDNAYLPWNDPKTAHIFASELSVTPADLTTAGFTDADSQAQEIIRRNGLRDLRQAYVGSIPTGENPISFDSWYDNVEAINLENRPGETNEAYLKRAKEVLRSVGSDSGFGNFSTAPTDLTDADKYVSELRSSTTVKPADRVIQLSSLVQLGSTAAKTLLAEIINNNPNAVQQIIDIPTDTLSLAKKWDILYSPGKKLNIDFVHDVLSNGTDEMGKEILEAYIPSEIKAYYGSGGSNVINKVWGDMHSAVKSGNKANFVAAQLLLKAIRESLKSQGFTDSEITSLTKEVEYGN